MRLGGFSPLPFSLGGGEPIVETLYNSLNISLGTAYDVSDASNVTAETMAEARALADVYECNQRMSYATDPKRMPAELLPRWEKIFDIHPHVLATDEDRRLALQAKFLALIGPAGLTDAITALINGSFVGLEFTPLASAYQRWLVNGFPNDWISTTAHILIRVQFTANQTLADFLNEMAVMTQMLDDFLPVYTTFDWGTFAEGGVTGFWLDDPVGSGPPPSNLDFEVFDS